MKRFMFYEVDNYNKMSEILETRGKQNGFL